MCSNGTGWNCSKVIINKQGGDMKGLSGSCECAEQEGRELIVGDVGDRILVVRFVGVIKEGREWQAGVVEDGVMKNSCRIQDRIADEENTGIRSWLGSHRQIINVEMVSQKSDLELINPVQLSREV